MATKDITDRQVCEAYRDGWASGGESDALSILQERTGQPAKVCFRAAERALARGLIDYGVSLRAGFPTGRGNALLSG